MNTNPINRREFLSHAASTTAVLSVTGAAMTHAAPAATTFRIQADQVRSLAAGPQGQLVVAADDRLVFHRADGTLERSLPTGLPVRAVAFDGKGGLFLSFKDQVARVVDGSTIERLGSSLGRQSALTGLAVSDAGDIFAADSGERVIWRLDAKGAVKGRITPEGREFTVPRAFFPIAWHDGRLLVADPGRHQVQAYSAEGRLLGQWGHRSREEDGFSGCCNPVALTVLADGAFITAERGQTRVKQFDAQGRLARVLAGPEQFLESTQSGKGGADDLPGCDGGLLDVAGLPGGKVAVLDRTTRKVRILG